MLKIFPKKKKKNILLTLELFQTDLFMKRMYIENYHLCQLVGFNEIKTAVWASMDLGNTVSNSMIYLKNFPLSLLKFQNNS